MGLLYRYRAFLLLSAVAALCAFRIRQQFGFFDYPAQYGSSDDAGFRTKAEVQSTATNTRLTTITGNSTSPSVTDCPLPTWSINPNASGLDTSFFLWSQHPESVNWSEPIEMCQAVLSSPNNSDPSIKAAKAWTIPYPHTDQSMLALLYNCTRFFEMVPFPTSPASEEEASFPLAYVFVGAKNAAQTIRFLRMIYQPQNAYCLTYDKKSAKEFRDTIIKFSQCFEGRNVFLSPRPETIYWGNYNLLRSVMTCLRVLLDRWKSVPWRYVQIVSWNDFPLKTNAEMVKIFKILNGSQDAEIKPVKYKWILKRHPDGAQRKIPPDGLRLYKGSFATSMTKEFVDFLFTNPTSQSLLEWFKGTFCAEEHYWQSMIYNIHLDPPGGFPGHCLDVYEHRRLYQPEHNATGKPFTTRFQIWQHKNVSGLHCYGRHKYFSCIFGVGDLPTLIQRPEMMAHKIYETFQPATAFCLEKWFWDRTSGRVKDSGLDEEFYRSFPSVRYQNMVDKDDFVC